MYTYNQLYHQYKKLYPIYIKKLILILNSVHNKKFNQKYWEPIIGLYLRRFILNYLFLKNISKNKKLFKEQNYRKINFFRSYSEYSNFNNHSLINEINFYDIKTEEVSKNYIIKNLSFYTKIINSIKTIIPNILIKSKITRVLFTQSYFKKILKNSFIFNSSFYFYSLPNFKLEDYLIETKKILKNRLSIIKKYGPKFQQEMLLKNIILFMPINYLENYKIIYDEVEKFNLSKGIYVDGSEVDNDFIKFYIGKLRYNKKIILTGQHSFRTGLDDYDAYFDYSNSISKYFLSWGWKNRSNKIKKFSSLRLFSSLKKYRKIKQIDNQISSICFILSGLSNVGDCLYDNFLENQKIEKTRIDLLKDLKKYNKIKTFLKPRSGSFLLNDKNKFYKSFNVLKDKTRMYDVFEKYSVIIFEKLSLGILESILLNQPTIFYYPKYLYRLKNDNYKNLLTLLKKANILLENKKKIQEIISNKDTISKWWLNNQNIQIRKKIIVQYGNAFTYKDFKIIKKLIP